MTASAPLSSSSLELAGTGDDSSTKVGQKEVFEVLEVVTGDPTEKEWPRRKAVLPCKRRDVDTHTRASISPAGVTGREWDTGRSAICGTPELIHAAASRPSSGELCEISS